MNKLIAALLALTIMSEASAVSYNCDTLSELDVEVMELQILMEDSASNPVVQSAVRDEYRFYQVLQEDLSYLCVSRPRSNRQIIKSIVTVEEWYEILD